MLPVLPVTDIGWLYATYPVQAEMVGWPGFTLAVAGVWDELSPAERSHAVIFTGSYGEAGAIDRFGGPLGLPRAVSGHNNVWYWGPGDPNATTVVAVLPNPDFARDARHFLQRFFTEVTPVATLHNSARVYNEESGGQVFVCRHPVAPWGELWPKLQHYD